RLCRCKGENEPDELDCRNFQVKSIIEPLHCDRFLTMRNLAGYAGFAVWWLVLGCLRAASCPPTVGEGGCLLCGRPACWANWVMPVRLGRCWWIVAGCAGFVIWGLVLGCLRPAS